MQNCFLNLIYPPFKLNAFDTTGLMFTCESFTFLLTVCNKEKLPVSKILLFCFAQYQDLRMKSIEMKERYEQRLQELTKVVLGG